MAHLAHKLHEKIEGTHTKKIADLAPDTVDIHTAGSIKTDHGTKVSNTDNWLKSVNEERTGPSLLEDQIAREKVRTQDPAKWSVDSIF